MERTRFIRPLIIGVVLAALVFVGYHGGLLDTAELKSLDLRFRIRGTVSPEAPIILVSIDQDSFDELELPWPWPRSLHAKLIRKLAAGQAKVIGLDVLFTEPKADPREDRELGEAIERAGNVVLAAEFTEVPSDFGPRTTIGLPIPVIRKGAAGYGPVNLITDQDGIVRRGRLAVPFQGKTFPSFASQIYRRIVGDEKPETENISFSPVIINFRGPARSYPIIPYYRILRDEIQPSVFRDKIVIVGAFSPSLHDVFPTPFQASEPTAGVEIQANLLETLIARDSITSTYASAYGAVYAFLLALVLWVSVHFKPLRALSAVLAVAVAYLFASLYLFSDYHLWLPLFPSLLGIVVSYGGITLDNYIREQKERIRTRAMLNKYVSPEVAAEILKHREGLGLGGKRTHITVLFSDIRGFTSISEQIGPEQVVSLLSDYLAQASHIVFKHGGTIDKFIGDAIFALFGWPKAYGDDALRAVKTGVELIELAESLGPKWTAVIGRPLKIGVGINTGEAVVGNIGSEIRSDLTAIGDTVNLGARLEALTKELAVPMLISEHTVAELKDAIQLRPLRRVKVVGREAPLLVYCPVGLLGGAAEESEDTAEPYRQLKK